jgi:enhancing lycopene biosynthesis protein 2
MEKASEMGAEVVEAAVDEVCVDETNLLVSTPAFMYDGAFHEIQDGVTKMIQHLFKLL